MESFSLLLTQFFLSFLSPLSGKFPGEVELSASGEKRYKAHNTFQIISEDFVPRHLYNLQPQRAFDFHASAMHGIFRPKNKHRLRTFSASLLLLLFYLFEIARVYFAPEIRGVFAIRVRLCIVSVNILLQKYWLDGDTMELKQKYGAQSGR